MFEKNLLAYEKDGEAGDCPICKGKLVVNIIKTPERKSVDISCIRCEKSEFYTGIFTPKKINER